MNSFTNKGMKPQPKKTNSIQDLKNKKNIAPIDSGALVTLKGGGGIGRPLIPKTN